MVAWPEAPEWAGCDPPYGNLAGVAFGAFGADCVLQVHRPRGRIGDRAWRWRRDRLGAGIGLGR